MHSNITFEFEQSGDNYQTYQILDPFRRYEAMALDAAGNNTLEWWWRQSEGINENK